MANNTAIVGVLSNIRPIEGADKIKLANVTVHGVTQAQVVVGVESKEGQKVVYFTSNMCLNPDTILKKYEDLGRYLGKAGRVRTVKLRGVISDGLAVEVEKFAPWAPISTLVEGFEFIDLGENICKRYEPPVRHVTQPKGDKKSKKLKKFNRLVEDQVRLHYDTDNLRRNAHKIALDDIVSISRKYHGTSAVCSNVLTKKILTLKEKIAKFFGVPVVETEYDYIYTSRTVVKNANINLGEQKHFYGFDLWTDAGEKTFKGKLAKGESAYYEIVGYLPSGGAIQKRYGYGCGPKEYKVYLYRMTMTNPDGVVREYTWPQLLERAKELEVPVVETYYYGTVRELTRFLDESYQPSMLVDWLEAKYLGKKAPDCNNNPDEGVVVRKEGLHVAEAYKLKDVAFTHRESTSFNAGEEDIEEGA